MRKAQWRMPLIVGASLAIHAAVLGPLALNSLGIDVAPLWDGPHPTWHGPIDVVLVRRPSLPGSPSRGRVAPIADRPFRTTRMTEIGPSAPDDLFRGGPVASSPAQSTPAPSPPRSNVSSSVGAPTDGLSETWRARANGLSSGPGRVGLDCRRAETMPPVERELCARRFAVADANAATARLGQRRLTRTESVREDGFAAIGDQALADYDRRRTPLKPNSRANPCPESPNPGDPCAFTIKGRIWSSRDGWLPDLPGRQ